MFWTRNKENSFPIRTLIWRPDDNNNDNNNNDNNDNNNNNKMSFRKLNWISLVQ